MNPVSIAIVSTARWTCFQRVMATNYAYSTMATRPRWTCCFSAATPRTFSRARRRAALLTAHYSLLAAYCSLPTTHHSLLTSVALEGALRTAHCYTSHHLMLTTHHLLYHSLTAYHSLLTTVALEGLGGGAGPRGGGRCGCRGDRRYDRRGVGR